MTLGEGGGNNVIQDIIHLQTRIEGLAYNNNNKMGRLIVITVVRLLLIGTHHH